MAEFAERGYAGGSTERIAAAAGISQSYVFRLFGSKLLLFLAVIEHCMSELHDLFDDASAGLRGTEALDAIGAAYFGLITSDPVRFQCQLVGYASCTQPEVRAVMRRGFGQLVELVERRSNADGAAVAKFFAAGMLFNVTTAMGLFSDPTTWGDRLHDGCVGDAAPMTRMAVLGETPGAAD
ncbi:MAG: transcriptional regulator, TetR family [Thermoleophilia bacterium]|nr:transcriptional regulator, TetR family [Thermoleophilia bacterium]